ncbi:MAG: S8 family serine peptidase [Pyrinomonadaceae bacterium]
MKRTLIVSMVFALALTSAFLFPHITIGQRNKLQKSSRPIPNRYIVVLNEAYDGERASEPGVRAEADYLSFLYGGAADKVFTNALKGFSTEMSAEQAELLSRDDRVKFVEEDSVVTITSDQTGATWGIDRIDQRSLPLNATYGYDPTGAGVHAYVIDTGIRSTHVDFGGRASVAFDAMNDGQNGYDCHGHGTHVAGTIGSSTYGVAKNVSLHGVRVTMCTGSTSVSLVMSGIDWVTANRINPAVVNISLGFAGISSALDTSVTNSIASGITYVIAAGNNGGDACSYSPGRTPNAITVGASRNTDARASYSNFGSCVDIFAPGSVITSLSNSSDTATTFLSGTSMSAPHVAGVAALYLESNPSASPSTVTQMILGSATTGVLTDVGSGSPDKLLYSRLGTPPTPTPTPTPAPTPTPVQTPTPTPTPTPVPPGQITIRKRGNGNGNGGGSTAITAFPYAATNLATANFVLYNATQPADTFIDSNIGAFGPTNSVSVTETQVTGWRLDSIDCTETSGGMPNVQNTTVDLANRRANIVVEAGEQIVCTFTSVELAPTAGDATISGRAIDSRGRGVKDVRISLLDANTGNLRYTTTNSFGFYTFRDVPVAHFYVLRVEPNKRYVVLDGLRSFTLQDDFTNVDFLVEK